MTRYMAIGPNIPAPVNRWTFVMAFPLGGMGDDRHLEFLGSTSLKNEWRAYMEADEFVIYSVNANRPRMSYGFHIPAPTVRALIERLHGRTVKSKDVQEALEAVVAEGHEVADPRPERIGNNISPIIALLEVLGKLTKWKEGHAYHYQFIDDA